MQNVVFWKWWFFKSRQMFTNLTLVKQHIKGRILDQLLVTLTFSALKVTGAFNSLKD